MRSAVLLVVLAVPVVARAGDCEIGRGFDEHLQCALETPPCDDACFLGWWKVQYRDAEHVSAVSDSGTRRTLTAAEWKQTVEAWLRLAKQPERRESVAMALVTSGAYRDVALPPEVEPLIHGTAYSRAWDSARAAHRGDRTLIRGLVPVLCQTRDQVVWSVRAELQPDDFVHAIAKPRQLACFEVQAFLAERALHSSAPGVEPLLTVRSRQKLERARREPEAWKKAAADFGSWFSAR